MLSWGISFVTQPRIAYCGTSVYVHSPRVSNSNCDAHVIAKSRVVIARVDAGRLRQEAAEPSLATGKKYKCTHMKNVNKGWTEKTV